MRIAASLGMVFLTLCAVVLLTFSALAQVVPTQQQTPLEQALSTKLLQEIQGGLSCNTNLIAVQAEFAKATARIKELESAPKQEPK